MTLAYSNLYGLAGDIGSCRWRHKLGQRRRGALARALALLTNELLCEIVDARRRHVAEGDDIALSLASRAYDLKPLKAAVDRLIDGRVRIEGTARSAKPDTMVAASEASNAGSTHIPIPVPGA
jgi:hypothetical protein